MQPHLIDISHHLRSSGPCVIENSMVIHNKEPTFFRGNVRSCIDHIFSNCPTHVDNVCTHSNSNTYNYTNLGANIINNSNPILSDHSIPSCNYTSKDINIPQQFRIIRNMKLLTKEKLRLYFKNNTAFNSIFSYSDPNIIANIHLRS